MSPDTPDTVDGTLAERIAADIPGTVIALRTYQRQRERLIDTVRALLALDFYPHSQTPTCACELDGALHCEVCKTLRDARNVLETIEPDW